MIHQRRNLGVGIDLDEPAAELFAFADPDQPGIVLGSFMVSRQQLLKHHRRLHPVGRRQRIELQRVLADRKLFLMGRPGNRAVDVGELPPLSLSHFQTFGGS